MESMTYPALQPFSEREHHRATKSVMVVVFWIIAALLVLAAHRTVEPLSTAGAVGAKVGAIVVAAYAYIRLTARRATLDHALSVGVVWVVFDVAAEMITAKAVGHDWFELIGSPAHPAVRDLLLVTWIAAPALFARYRSV